MIKKVLSIAGSDPSGGAGIQADLKTFSALGCYGMAAITALTAQNTQGVSGVQIVDAKFLKAQLDAIFSDIQVDAVKIGMVGDVDSIGVIADALQRYKPPFVVLDPVMVATSGDVLIESDCIEALQQQLVPLASVITPNIPEAEILAEQSFYDLEQMAQSLLQVGANAVLLKGGHLDDDDSVDIICSADFSEVLSAPRIQTNNTHDTGCTLSSALACFLAKGENLQSAARLAKDYLTHALTEADNLIVGQGHGPVHHFYDLWKKP